MPEFYLLDQETASVYEDLTYPRFRSLLLNLTPDAPVVALGVTSHAEPIGLILAKTFTNQNTQETFAEILSLFVVPEYRCQGIGQALVSQIETELSRRNCQSVSLIYLESPSTPALETILEHRGWSKPQVQTSIYVLKRANLEKLNQFYSTTYLPHLLEFLPAEYSLFPWGEVTQLQREQIIQDQQELFRETSNYSRASFPSEEKLIELRSSLGLCYQDKVVGWMINHRMTPDTVTFTSLYVYPEHQPLSRCLLLGIKSLNLQIGDPTFQQGSFRCAVNNLPMVKVYDRFVRPYTDSVRSSFTSWKKLINQIENG